MKRKGFTLIELIAVIVILAIIALIAIPVITGIVNKSKKGAAEASALNYIDAVEKYVMLHDLDSTKYPYDLRNNTFNVADSTDISLLDIIIPKAKAENTIPALNSFITVKGDKPKDGTVTIDKKGKVVSADLYISGHNVSCASSSCSAEKGVRVKYIVTYDANGGTGTMNPSKNVVVDNAFTAPTGALFKEWNTKADGSGDVYTTSTELTSDVTLYAQWEYKPYILGQAVKINGTDWFVIANSPSTSKDVRLVSKYNIRANASATTTKDLLFVTNEADYRIRFQNGGPNWGNDDYATSTLKPIVEGNFKQALQNSLNITINSIGLLELDDMKALGCVHTINEPNKKSDTLNCNSSQFLNTIITTAISWTNVPAYCNGCSVLGLFKTSSSEYGLYRGDSNGLYQGVRPVITISKEYID